MHFFGIENDYQERKPAKVDKWYDRYLRLWVIQLKDAEGNQLGNAEYAANRQEAEKQVKEWEREYFEKGEKE